MSFAIALSDMQWELVADLFDPPGRRGAPALIPRRAMVDAMLFIGRTGIQWRYLPDRYLPDRYPPWTAVWSQWRRWRANGVWTAAMARLAAIVRWLHDREPAPSMVMVDAQTVKGARYGPTFHQAGGRGGRTIGTKRTLLVEILGLPVAAAACSARPHDVVAAARLAAQPDRRAPAPGGDRRRPCLSRPGQARGAQARRARHQGATGRHERVRPHPAAGQDRARVCPAWALATPVALLRGQRRLRPRVARSRLGRLPRLARLGLTRSFGRSAVPGLRRSPVVRPIPASLLAPRAAGRPSARRADSRRIPCRRHRAAPSSPAAPVGGAN